MIADAGVVKPADIRAPGAEIEATGVSEVEATLKRRLSIGLRQAAEYVLAIDAEVAGDRIGLGRLGRLSGWIAA